VGVKDVSGHSVGGVIFWEDLICPPTVFCLVWSEDTKADLISCKNPKGSLTNSGISVVVYDGSSIAFRDIVLCPALATRRTIGRAFGFNRNHMDAVTFVKRERYRCLLYIYEHMSD
jgi:hypothetical protein